MKKVFFLLILLLTAGLTLGAQPASVSGTLVDEAGNPIPGAAVFIVGTTTGTVTDEQGHWAIKVPGSDAVLRFESLGYEAVQCKVGNRRSIPVTMREDVSYLDEVVVIGFGEQKKSDLTGSVVNVNMNDVLASPSTSVDQALQGKVAGADILSTSGDPTAGTSIRIRGTRSITASNEPLIVVDGVMNAVNDLADINPDSIESISVLKDASSTAIYGSQGANGVIIVTTKQGSPVESKPNVTLTIKAGFSQLAKHLDIMNAEEFARYNNERVDFTKSQNATATWPDTFSYAAKYRDPEALGVGTDWMQAVTRVAPYQEYALSISGNNKKITNYFGQISYLDNQGVIVNSGMQRVNGRVSIGHQFAKWFTLKYNMQAMYRYNNNNKATIGGTSPWNGVIYMSPAQDTSSTINDLYDYGRGTKFNNPYISTQLCTNYRESWSNNHSITLEFRPIKDMVIKSQNTFYLYNTALFQYNPSTLPAKNPGDGGDLNRSEQRTVQLSSDNTVTWKKAFKGGHNLDLMGGFSIYHNVLDNLTYKAKTMLVDDVKWNDLSGIGDKLTITPSSSNRTINRLSVLARFNYNWKKRYYLTFTGRADASSNFAANRKWGFFPSGAFKWTISNEPWLKKTRIFQDLSLRLTAGRTGNDAISAYSSLEAMDSATTGYIIGGTQSTYYYPVRLASPNLTWETTDAFNAALDMSVLKGRIKLTLEGYYSMTKDLLLYVQKATQSGYTQFLQNIGRTSNRGVELTLSTQNIVTKDFSWTTELTVSHNKQMVDDIGSEDFVTTMEFKDYRIYGYVKGYPLNALWGFQYGGVWHNQLEIAENEATHQYGDFYSEKYPGRPRYVDQNHDGVLNDSDLVYLGTSDPIVYGGLQNNFHIFGFNLGIYFAYSIGGSIYNIPELFMSGTYTTNQYRYMMNAWHPVRNPNSDIPVAGGSGYSQLPSSFAVHDASYLRLKTVSLSYLFQFRKGFVKSLNVGVSADNLWLWTGYNGFDPDVSSDGESSTLRRVDTGAYPRARKIVASVQLKF